MLTVKPLSDDTVKQAYSIKERRECGRFGDQSSICGETDAIDSRAFMDVGLRNGFGKEYTSDLGFFFKELT